MLDGWDCMNIHSGNTPSGIYTMVVTRLTGNFYKPIEKLNQQKIKKRKPIQKKTKLNPNPNQKKTRKNKSKQNSH